MNTITIGTSISKHVDVIANSQSYGTDKLAETLLWDAEWVNPFNVFPFERRSPERF